MALQFAGNRNARMSSVVAIDYDHVFNKPGLLQYDPQSLTTAQKRQARGNIGAARDTVIDIVDLGAVPYGPDCSAIINQAIPAANAAGGKTIYLPPGNFLISSSIIPMSFVPIVGAGIGVTRLICDTDELYAQVAGSQLYKAGLSNLSIFAASGHEDAIGIKLTAAQHNNFTDLHFSGFHTGKHLVINGAAITDPDQDADPTYYNSNILYNHFKRWYSSGCAVGIEIFGGYGTTPTASPANSSNQPNIVATTNVFDDIELWNVTEVGINIIGACDTERFGKIGIRLAGTNPIGVNIASDPVFTGNNYVNSHHFDQLTFSLEPGTTGAKLIKLGWTFAITGQVKHDINTSLITEIDDVAAQSYHFLVQRFLGAHLRLEVLSKGTQYLGTGSETAPLIASPNDLDTGIWFPAVGTMDITQGGGASTTRFSDGSTSPSGALRDFTFRNGGDIAKGAVSYGGEPGFRGYRANGNSNVPTAVTSGQALARFDAGGWDSAGWSPIRASLVARAAENWTATANGTYIGIEITPPGTEAPYEVARWINEGLFFPAGRGLVFQDTNASHALIVTYDSNITGNRTLKIKTPDANSVLDLSDGGRLAPTNLPQGAIIGRAYAEYASNADLSTVFPFDDTIPQNTEGTEVLTATITPKSATSRIRVRFNAHGATATGSIIVAALFVDSAPDALQTKIVQPAAAGYHAEIGFEYEHEHGGTVGIAKTYKVRVGTNSGAMRLNGSASARYYGGSEKATLVVEEINP